MSGIHVNPRQKKLHTLIDEEGSLHQSALKWFRSLLFDRCFPVSLCDVPSSSIVSGGVPQGSNLGPVPFSSSSSTGADFFFLNIESLHFSLNDRTQSLVGIKLFKSHWARLTSWYSEPVAIFSNFFLTSGYRLWCCCDLPSLTSLMSHKKKNITNKTKHFRRGGKTV